MSKLIPYKDSEAILLWNNFSSALAEPVPFSFNPSLFFFYKNHFKWKPYYILIYQNKELTGLLPLIFTGKMWVSVPHFSYGGILLKPLSQIKQQGLQYIDKIISLLENGKYESGFYQFHADTNLHVSRPIKKLYVRSLTAHSASSKSQKVTSILSLPANKELLPAKLSSNLKRKIKKALKSDFYIQKGGIELLSDFYTVYSHNMHRLGSPAYGKDFFRSLINTYRYGNALFFIVYDNYRPVGGALLLSYTGFSESAWFATEKIAHKKYVSDFLHWNMIKYAIEEKSTIYSFGRSTKNGKVYKYKNHWPVQNKSLYEYSPLKIDIKKLRILSYLWRAMPYRIVNILGPKLINHLY